jgi:uncharacterized membrane protein YphA (DoxX/SURF4 family)
MSVALWIVQIVLAVAFGGAGFMKSTKPKEALAPMMSWVNHFSAGQVKTIGVLELLAAIGLILPKLTNILPWLTPLAAIGLVLTMIGAAITHIRIKDYGIIGANVVLGALAAFVAYGYWDLLPL